MKFFAVFFLFASTAGWAAAVGYGGMNSRRLLAACQSSCDQKFKAPFPEILQMSQNLCEQDKNSSQCQDLGLQLRDSHDSDAQYLKTCSPDEICSEVQNGGGAIEKFSQDVVGGCWQSLASLGEKLYRLGDYAWTCVSKENCGKTFGRAGYHNLTAAQADWEKLQEYNEFCEARPGGCGQAVYSDVICEEGHSLAEVGNQDRFDICDEFHSQYNREHDNNIKGLILSIYQHEKNKFVCYNEAGKTRAVCGYILDIVLPGVILKGGGLAISTAWGLIRSGVVRGAEELAAISTALRGADMAEDVKKSIYDKLKLVARGQKRLTETEKQSLTAMQETANKCEK